MTNFAERLYLAVGLSIVGVMLVRWAYLRIVEIRRLKSRVKDLEEFNDAKHLLQISRSDGVRYEVEFNDWGEEHLDMRYRWTIWDADRYILMLYFPQSIEGVLVPYMLGNAPTREVAETEAMDWVRKHDLDSIVVTKDMS